MKTDEQGPYIELADFLKFLGLAATGGQAKLLIRSGDVRSTTKRKKEYDGSYETITL